MDSDVTDGDGAGAAAGADPGRDAWLRERRTGLGSSDAAAVAGLSPYATALHVYLDKLGRLPPRDTAPRRWGRRLEDVVADAYREETGRQVCPPPARLLRHPSVPWMLASLDRMTVVDGLPRAVEIKTAGARTDAWGQPGTDEVPVEYVIQVQHQLAVTGWRAADVCVLFRGQELAVYEVPRSDRVIADLERVLGDFWGMVERRQEPEPQWEHPLTLDLVRGLYGVEDGAAADLGGQEAQWAHLYLATKQAVRDMQAECDRYQARLLHAMGAAGVARLPGGYTCVRKAVRRRAYSVPAGQYTTFKVHRPKGDGREPEEG